jgi:hypothetical protein
LYVLDHDDHPILLGVDCLTKLDAGIYPKRKLLIIGDDHINLNDENKYSYTEKLNNNNDNDWEYLNIATGGEDFDINLDEQDWSVRPIAIKPVEVLTSEQMVSFNKITAKIQKQSAQSYLELGNSTTMVFEIKTKDEIPINLPPYRKPETEKKLIDEEIDKMLKAGVIRLSESPWSSPVVMVTKKDKSKRMCIDYRELNQKTVLDSWPLPRIDDIIQGLHGSKWFSQLDLKSGYWQVKMEQESIAKTAFSTHNGHYEFLRMPFGLKNAPKKFSRMMHQLFKGLKFVECYLDDITIHSKTFDEHVEHVKMVLEILENANLKLNHDKCSWFAKKIHVLGYIVSDGCYSIDPKRTEAISKRISPKCVNDVQKEMGIVNFFKQFVPNLAHIAAP